MLIKDKENLFHSALYCDLNLLEVRAKELQTQIDKNIMLSSPWGLKKVEK